MAFQRFYGKTDYKNLPSQDTPLNRKNLLNSENGIEELDKRTVQLDGEKAPLAVVNTMVKDVSLDTKTGILTVTLQNGTIKTYDLDIEKVVTNFDINDNNELVLTLADGTQKVIDLTRFVYSVDSTATVAMKILDRTITAEIVDGSVTMDKLDTAIRSEFRQYLFDAQDARDAAQNYQLYAKRYTMGDDSFPGSETDNARFYYDHAKAEADRAESYAGQANTGALTGTEAIDRRGLLGTSGATVWAQTLIDKMIDNNISDVEIDELDELVFIPKFKNSDVLAGGNNNTHPAFIVNGVEIPGFYYSKYQNVVKTVDGVSMAYSLYGKDPAVNINFDNARARCEAKGKGYHLSTMAEWAAIALWCKKNGFMPYGNNNYGKDTSETDYVAIPTSKDTTDPNKNGRVATGTGPLTWSHDETNSGIWDLNGNVYEWQGGYRTVYGEVQILANNDASDSDNQQNSTSQLWKAINATTGNLVEPGITGTVKLDYVSNKWTYCTSIMDSKDSNRYCPFHNITFTADIKQPAQDLLRALAMLPVDGDTNYGDDYFYANNGAPERLTFRGGHWYNGTGAGVFCVRGNLSRSTADQYIGFRSAYIPDIEP